MELHGKLTIKPHMASHLIIQKSIGNTVQKDMKISMYLQHFSIFQINLTLL